MAIYGCLHNQQDQEQGKEQGTDEQMPLENIRRGTGVGARTGEEIISGAGEKDGKQYHRF